MATLWPHKIEIQEASNIYYRKVKQMKKYEIEDNRQAEVVETTLRRRVPKDSFKVRRSFLGKTTLEVEDSESSVAEKVLEETQKKTRDFDKSQREENQDENEEE